MPADTDAATCTGLSPSQLSRLRRPPAPPDPAIPADPAGPAADGRGDTGTDVGLMRCGPPEADGSRTCTAAKAGPSTTTAPATYRCTEAQDTLQLTCVSALG